MLICEKNVSMRLELRVSPKSGKRYECVVVSLGDKDVVSFDKSLIDYLKSYAIYDYLDKIN